MRDERVLLINIFTMYDRLYSLEWIINWEPELTMAILTYWEIKFGQAALVRWSEYGNSIGINSIYCQETTQSAHSTNECIIGIIKTSKNTFSLPHKANMTNKNIGPTFKTIKHPRKYKSIYW